MGPKKGSKTAMKKGFEVPDEFKKQPTLLQQCPTIQTIMIDKPKNRVIVEMPPEPPLTDMEARLHSLSRMRLLASCTALNQPTGRAAYPPAAEKQ